MYTVISAARIRIGSFDKRGLKCGGSSLEARIDAVRHADALLHALTAFTASPSALPGARLKLTMVDGNCPWWPIASCARVCSQCASVLSGTCVPLLDFTYRFSSVGGIGLEVMTHFHHDVILIQLRKDGRDLPLAEGIVERVVDIGHGNAQPCRSIAVDDELSAEPLILQVAGNVRYGRVPCSAPAPSCACRSRVPQSSGSSSEY